VRKTNFPAIGSAGNFRTYFSRSPSSAAELIGALCRASHRGAPLHPAQIKLLETFADQAVIAIENVRLFKELDERTTELNTLVGELKALGEVSQVVTRLSTSKRY